MQEVTQIVHAGYLIVDEQQVLLNHALIIEQGKILAIVPNQEVTKNYTSACVEHFPHSVILPGFINAHTHIGMNFFRGLADDLDLGTWLNQHIWPAERAWLSEEFVYDASLVAAAEMIRSGTTTCNEMYFFLNSTAKAIIQAGMRAYIAIHIPYTPWAQNNEDNWQAGLPFCEQYRNHELVKITLAPHSIYVVADHNLLLVQQAAEQYKLKINMHVQETAWEVDQSIAHFKQRPLKRLHDLGLLSDSLLAIHMTQVNEEDLAILRQTKVNVVHCPESNMKLASGACPVSELISNGINVALGTDSVASNNDLDMLGEMRSAALLAKLSTGNSQALSANQVLAMATINGAKALGAEQHFGSLSVGKAADFIALELDNIESQPLYNVISQIVYSSCRNQVTDVWVAGKRLLKNRQLLTLNEQELFARLKYWQQKISATRG